MLNSPVYWKKRGDGVFTPGTNKHSACAGLLGKLRKLLTPGLPSCHHKQEALAGCFRVSHDDSFWAQQPERAGSEAEDPEWDYFHHSLCMEVSTVTSTQPGFSISVFLSQWEFTQVSLLHRQNNKQAFTLYSSTCQCGNAHVFQASKASQFPAYSSSHLTTKCVSILRAFLPLRVWLGYFIQHYVLTYFTYCKEKTKHISHDKVLWVWQRSSVY